MKSNTVTPSNNGEILLLCGIPGSGKTTYCKWLAQQKRFDHLNFDELLSGIGPPKHLQLVELLKTSAKEFVHKVSRGGRTVIDWGFPLACIGLVRELEQRGVSVWWFDGDREAALQSFTARGDVPVEAFRIQMAAIEQGWSQIKDIVKGRTIKTVAAGPTHLASEEIFLEMFRSGE